MKRGSPRCESKHGQGAGSVVRGHQEAEVRGHSQTHPGTATDRGHVTKRGLDATHARLRCTHSLLEKQGLWGRVCSQTTHV